MDRKNKFNYNDGVIIKKNTPEKFHPGKSAIICGIDPNPISTEIEAKEFFCEIGEWVYTVEFSDGSSIEISENHLELDPKCLKYCLGERVIIKKDFSSKKDIIEVVSIIDYHKITGTILAKKFHLDLDDFIYAVENQQGRVSLIPESFIEKKYETV